MRISLCPENPKCMFELTGNFYIKSHSENQISGFQTTFADLGLSIRLFKSWCLPASCLWFLRPISTRRRQSAAWPVRTSWKYCWTRCCRQSSRQPPSAQECHPPVRLRLPSRKRRRGSGGGRVRKEADYRIRCLPFLSILTNLTSNIKTEFGPILLPTVSSP